MNIHILTLFPSAFPGPLGCSLINDAIQKGIAKIHIHDLKIASKIDQYHEIDDKPLGGGAGMLIKCDTIHNAIINLNLEHTYKIFLSPRGYKFSQAVAQALTKIPQDILILCGRYEGVDERVLEHWNFAQISIGDYVLCGGEVAAMVLLETCIRILPGVVNKEASILQDTFSNNMLEHKQYTKPREWNSYPVPEVLLSGNHEQIQAYRNAESKILTFEHRKDLWEE